VTYQNVIVRLGGFHIVQNFLGAIGYLMKGSGLEDILFVSGVCAKGTINKVMSGKDYYKIIRCHSLAAEDMMRLKWGAFEDWLDDKEETDCIQPIAEKFNHLMLTLKDKDLEESHMLTQEVTHLLESIEGLWADFEATLGVTAKFWDMYIDMGSIAKRYIHAERSGDWLKHLAEVEKMLPYLVSAGHHNYMSCIPIYLKDMKSLNEIAPKVNEEFLKGNFTIHHTCGKFNCVWTDLALEQTYNKEGKTCLLIGITLNPTAREKYIKSAPFMTRKCHIHGAY
jgi:hypothetical protein